MSALCATLYEWRWDTLSLSLSPPSVLFYGIGLSSQGRQRGRWREEVQWMGGAPASLLRTMGVYGCGSYTPPIQSNLSPVHQSCLDQQ